VLLEKQVRRVSIDDVLLTLLKMTNPVATRILQLWWQVAVNRLSINLSSQNSRIREIAHVLSKARRHEIKAATRQLLVRTALIYPEAVVAAPFSVE
jgi:hypothetical protein